MIANVATFSGFRPQALEFLANLRANNSREWFQPHRQEYEQLLLEPARELVLSVGARLRALGPDIHAEPKVHGSIFAINRDTRFSADKTPYKTHLDLWFWQGGLAKQSRERPGYFFRLTPENLILGAGMHLFPEQALERYRQAILDDAKGEQLEQIANAIGPEAIHGQTYKRVPNGLPADHPRADWLRHSGLFAELDQRPAPDELFSEAFPDWCFARFQRVAPLQQWLVDLLPSAE